MTSASWLKDINDVDSKTGTNDDGSVVKKNQVVFISPRSEIPSPISRKFKQLMVDDQKSEALQEILKINQKSKNEAKDTRQFLKQRNLKKWLAE